VIVNYMRDYQLSLGLPRSQVYNQTMYILTGMLLLGFVCNLMIRPVADKWFMSDEELAKEKQLSHEKALSSVVTGKGGDEQTATLTVVLAWAAVVLPLSWGVYKTIVSAMKLFA